MIGEVEELGAELHPSSLAEAEVFHEGEIDDLVTRTLHDIFAGVPERTRSHGGILESASVEDGPGHTRRAVGILPRNYVGPV